MHNVLEIKDFKGIGGMVLGRIYKKKKKLSFCKPRLWLIKYLIFSSFQVQADHCQTCLSFSMMTPTPWSWPGNPLWWTLSAPSGIRSRCRLHRAWTGGPWPRASPTPATGSGVWDPAGITCLGWFQRPALALCSLYPPSLSLLYQVRIL